MARPRPAGRGFAARLFAVENIPIVGYDRCIAWYEVGTGVSTNEGARARMLRDWRAMVELLRGCTPKTAPCGWRMNITSMTGTNRGSSAG